MSAKDELRREHRVWRERYELVTEIMKDRYELRDDLYFLSKLEKKILDKCLELRRKQGISSYDVCGSSLCSECEYYIQDGFNTQSSDLNRYCDYK